MKTRQELNLQDI